MTVYRLLQISVNEGNATDAGTGEVFIGPSWLFLTRDEALRQMREAVKRNTENDWQDEVYCFYVLELPIGVEFYPQSLRGCVSWEAYDRNGNLLDKSLCSEAVDKDGNLDAFNGRPERMARFKRGDIVEVLDLYNEKLVPMFVIDAPVTPEWCAKHRHSDDLRLDYTDDSYTVCDGDDYMAGHEHISPMFIFKSRTPLPDALTEKFAADLKKILDEF